MQRFISSHAEAAKIGRHIADEVLEKWRSDSNQSSPHNGGSPSNFAAVIGGGSLNNSGPKSVGALPVSSKVSLLVKSKVSLLVSSKVSLLIKSKVSLLVKSKVSLLLDQRLVYC